MRKYIIIIYVILLSHTCNAQWNDWKDAKTVRSLMKEAQQEKKTYFSQFHVWDVRSDNIHSSPFHERTGEILYVYSLDFYYATGSYFADDYQERCRKNIVEVVKKQWHDNRAIPSFSWHLENPYVESGFQYMGCRYTTTEHESVIREILSGKGGTECGNGRYFAKETAFCKSPKSWFDERCREVASLIDELVDDNGKPIPMIIRLWHECEDSWMWWGANSTTPEEFKKFFILSEKKLKRYSHNAQILWAYCPDSYWKTEDEYMLRYPGDKYVDFIGYDDYQIGNPSKHDTEIQKARIVTKVALEHGKIAALFEGDNKLEASTDNYFKDYLSPLLNDDNVRFSIVQLWSTSLLENEKQIKDRKWFLAQPNILSVK